MKMDYPAGDTSSLFHRSHSGVLTQLRQLIFNKRGSQLPLMNLRLSVQVYNETDLPRHAHTWGLYVQSHRSFSWAWNNTNLKRKRNKSVLLISQLMCETTVCSLLVCIAGLLSQRSHGFENKQQDKTEYCSRPTGETAIIGKLFKRQLL